MMKISTLNKIFIVFLFFVFSEKFIFASSADYRIVIQSGHNGPVVAVDWHASSKSVVSAGADGRIIVTKPETNRIVNRFQVSKSRISRMKIHPQKTLVAVTFQKENKTLLQVWDWHTQTLIYEYSLKLEPLFFNWSAKGKYLIISNLDSPNIILLDSRNAHKLPYLKNLESIYSMVYIGSTENILMTYNPSGIIEYWDIRSSTLKLFKRTVSGLQDIAVLQTGIREILFARRNDKIYLLNRTTGAVLHKLQIPGLSQISFDDKSGELDVLSSTPDGLTLHGYSVKNNRFVFRKSGNYFSNHTMPIQNIKEPLKLLRKVGNSFIIGGNGELMVADSGIFLPVINDKHWKIDNMEFHDSSLFLNSGNRIMSFESSFFSVNSNGNTEYLLNLFRKEITTSSNSPDTGLSIDSSGQFFQWDKSGSAFGNGIRKFDFNAPEKKDFFPISGLIKKVQIVDLSSFLVVGQAGSVSLFDNLKGDIISSYTAMGLLDAAYSREAKFILAGFSSKRNIGTPLTKIDTRTKRSVPIPDDRFMVYQINAGMSGLYSIGLKKKSDDQSYFSLVWHDSAKPEKSWELYESRSEDTSGYILPAPNGNDIYVAVDNHVKQISGGKIIEYNWPKKIKQLAVRGKVLYGIDTDGSLVLWNNSGGYAKLVVYFFDDGGWLAFDTNSQEIWSTPGAIENIEIFLGNERVNPKEIKSIID